MRKAISLLVLCLMGIQALAIQVSDTFAGSSTIEYAKTEAVRLGNALQATSGTTHKPLSFTFRYKKAYAATGTFAYSCNHKLHVTLTAADPIGILHALYSFCEDAGVIFDITGTTLPDHADWSHVAGRKRVITPHVRWRGIRQHVNFPMDISSYPIGQVRTYLENMVRMRFNKLTIHSYPMQWYEEDVTGETHYAGQFFYGNKHHFGHAPFLKQIATLNDSIFCIPEAETVFDSPRQCSQVAIRWMQQLMQEAKRLGLRIQLSFEPRTYTVEQTTRLARKLIDTYPLVDDLELMTEETGGWGAACTDKEVTSTLTRWFGPEILADTLVTRVIAPRQNDLAYLCAQIGTIQATIHQLEADPDFGPGGRTLKAGIYCSVGKYIEAVYHLARRSLPDHYIAVMPSHGSEGTSQAFGRFIRTREDLARTELYSWIEFDGLMYQQQNAIHGIGTLLQQMDSLNNGAQLHSLLFNHWRTAENRTSFRYAAETTLGPTVMPDPFYRAYATRLGIADTDTYGRAMHLIDQADQFSKAKLGNIGFCWVGAWRNGGSYTWMNPDHIAHCSQLYVQAGKLIAKLYGEAATSPARSYLELLGNRVLCSLLYMDAFREATAIRTIHKDADGQVPPEERQRAVEICNHALLGFERYMQTYARLLPDRGSEGTVMSIWFSPMRGLRILRSQWGGTPLDEPAHSDRPLDEPPLPIFYE